MSDFIFLTDSHSWCIQLLAPFLLNGIPVYPQINDFFTSISTDSKCVALHSVRFQMLEHFSVKAFLLIDLVNSCIVSDAL